MEASRNEIGSLVKRIQDAAATLEDLSSRFDEGLTLPQNLLSAYQEGSISLDVFLGSIEIVVSSLSTYYDDLANYYTDVLRLEFLTGADILVLDE